MEGKLLSLKNDIEVIQITKPSWTIEIKNKLTTLKTVPEENLGINEIKDWKSETWGRYEEKVNYLLEEELNMGTSDIYIERAHRIGEKKTGGERQIALQFSSYKHKLNILGNYKKLKGTNVSVSGDFSIETASIRKEKWTEVIKNRKDV